LADPFAYAYAQTVAYWRFENGTANATASGTNSILDSSGNNLHGTPLNGPVYRSTVPVNPIPLTGAANTRSLDFDGVNARVAIPDYTALQLTQSLTLEAYIFPRAFASVQLGHAQIVFRGDDRAGRDPYYLSLLPDGRVAFSINDAADNQVILRAAIPGLNQWTHVAGTLDDATGKMSLYVNGTLIEQLTTSIRPFATLDPTQNPGLGIGNLQSAAHQDFNGLIDEVRISNVALSPDQFLTPVPEPATVGLIAAAGLAAGGLLRRKFRRL
jgi:hypothetical protein